MNADTAKFTLDTSGVVTVLNHDGWEHVMFDAKWSDLDPFTQGYVEALFAGGVEGYAHQLFLREFAEGRKPWAFSDLAPETLAAILKDCEKFKEDGYGSADDDAVDGSMFWGTRQAGEWADVGFPPLTASLGDDGRVYLRVAS